MIDLSKELEFHGIEYIIFVSVSDGPVIDVEQVVSLETNTGVFALSPNTKFCFRSERRRAVMHGIFSANNTEEVTYKNGNFKKHSMLAKMLASSSPPDRAVRNPREPLRLNSSPPSQARRECLHRPPDLRGTRNAAKPNQTTFGNPPPPPRPLRPLPLPLSNSTA